MQLSIRNLATALLSQEWNESNLRSAYRLATGLPLRKSSRFLRELLARYPSRPPRQTLLAYLDSVLNGPDVPIRRLFIAPQMMGSPPPAAGIVTLPQLPTEA